MGKIPSITPGKTAAMIDRSYIAWVISLVAIITTGCDRNSAELIFAVKEDQVLAVREALSKNPELVEFRDDQGRTLAHLAALEDSPKVMEYLLEIGIDFTEQDSNGFLPIHNAAARGSGKIVKLLLEKGPRIQDQDLEEKPLLGIVSTGHVSREILHVLVEFGASWKSEHERVIHATFSGDMNRLVKKLHDESEDIEAFGWSLLHWAVAGGNEEVVDYLLSRSFPTETVSGDLIERTPLHLAIGFNDLRIAKLLIENGANIEARTIAGNSPLHEASYAGYGELVELLVEAGANVNATNNPGWSPLHYAARKGDMKTSRYLVRAGADTGIVTGSAGYTAADFAKRASNEKLSDWLNAEAKDQEPE